MQKDVAFIRACDMCKDALTGGGVKDPAIKFASIGASIGTSITSIDSGMKFGSDLKESIMDNNPKIKSAKGNLEIIELLQDETGLIDNLRMYTLDANIIPNYYRCTEKYQKSLTDVPVCTTIFDPKQISSDKEYVITVATLLDPYKCTFGKILMDPIEIDDKFMRDSGFIAGDNTINISNIDQPTKITKKTDYTFDVKNFMICGIDFLSPELYGLPPTTKPPTSSDLILFCSKSSNSEIAGVRDETLLKAKLIAKECGDTLHYRPLF